MFEKQNPPPPKNIGYKSLADVPVDPVRKNRLVLLDAAARKLAEAEAMLAELIATYPKDGCSACHPASGFTSNTLQVAKLRKALERSAV